MWLLDVFEEFLLKWEFVRVIDFASDVLRRDEVDEDVVLVGDGDVVYVIVY